MVCWGAGVGQPCFLSQLSPLAFLPLPGYSGRPLEWGLSRTAAQMKRELSSRQGAGYRACGWWASAELGMAAGGSLCLHPQGPPDSFRPPFRMLKSLTGP